MAEQLDKILIPKGWQITSKKFKTIQNDEKVVFYRPVFVYRNTEYCAEMKEIQEIVTTKMLKTHKIIIKMTQIF